MSMIGLRYVIQPCGIPNDDSIVFKNLAGPVARKRMRVLLLGPLMRYVGIRCGAQGRNRLLAIKIAQ